MDNSFDMEDDDAINQDNIPQNVNQFRIGINGQPVDYMLDANEVLPQYIATGGLPSNAQELQANNRLMHPHYVEYIRDNVNMAYNQLNWVDEPLVSAYERQIEVNKIASNNNQNEYAINRTNDEEFNRVGQQNRNFKQQFQTNLNYYFRPIEIQPFPNPNNNPPIINSILPINFITFPNNIIGFAPVQNLNTFTQVKQAIKKQIYNNIVTNNIQFNNYPQLLHYDIFPLTILQYNEERMNRVNIINEQIFEIYMRKFFVYNTARDIDIGYNADNAEENIFQFPTMPEIDLEGQNFPIYLRKIINQIAYWSCMGIIRNDFSTIYITFHTLHARNNYFEHLGDQTDQDYSNDQNLYIFERLFASIYAQIIAFYNSNHTLNGMSLNQAKNYIESFFYNYKFTDRNAYDNQILDGVPLYTLWNENYQQEPNEFFINGTQSYTKFVPEDNVDQQQDFDLIPPTWYFKKLNFKIVPATDANDLINIADDSIQASIMNNFDPLTRILRIPINIVTERNFQNRPIRTPIDLFTSAKINGTVVQDLIKYLSKIFLYVTRNTNILSNNQDNYVNIESKATFINQISVVAVVSLNNNLPLGGAQQYRIGRTERLNENEIEDKKQYLRNILGNLRLFRPKQLPLNLAQQFQNFTPQAFLFMQSIDKEKIEKAKKTQELIQQLLSLFPEPINEQERLNRTQLIIQTINDFNANKIIRNENIFSSTQIDIQDLEPQYSFNPIDKYDIIQIRWGSILPQTCHCLIKIFFYFKYIYQKEQSEIDRFDYVRTLLDFLSIKTQQFNPQQQQNLFGELSVEARILCGNVHALYSYLLYDLHLNIGIYLYDVQNGYNLQADLSLLISDKHCVLCDRQAIECIKVMGNTNQNFEQQFKVKPLPIQIDEINNTLFTPQFLKLNQKSKQQYEKSIDYQIKNGSLIIPQNISNDTKPNTIHLAWDIETATLTPQQQLLLRFNHSDKCHQIACMIAVKEFIDTSELNQSKCPDSHRYNSQKFIEQKVFSITSDLTEQQLNQPIYSFVQWIKEVLVIDNSQYYGDKSINNKTQFIFWSFNGAKFDHLFIFAELIEVFGAMNVSITGTQNDLKQISLFNGMILFNDLRLIFSSGSLDKLAKEMKVQHQKDTTFQIANHSTQTFIANKSQIEKYCLMDVDCLIDLVNNMYNQIHLFHHDMKQYPSQHKKINKLDKIIYCKIISLSSLSWSLFKQYFLNIELQGCSSQEIYEIIKSSYFGGTTQSFKQFFESSTEIPHLNYYDINSLYPYIMSKYAIPYAIDYKEQEKSFNCNKQAIRQFLLQWSSQQDNEIYQISSSPLIDTDLYFVQYLKFKECVRHTCIPVRIPKSGALIYPQIVIEQWIWGAKLKFLLINNQVQDLQILKVIHFKAMKIFEGYVNFLYEKRKKHQQMGEDCQANFTKLLMNGLYGKTAQKLFPTYQFINNKELGTILQNNPYSFGSIEQISQKIWKLTKLTPFNLNKVGSLVQIASYITCQASCEIMKYVIQCNNQKSNSIYYMDTDSIITSETLLPSQVGKELGQMKLEDQIKKAYFLGLKMYLIKTVGDKTIMKIKGIQNKVIQESNFEQLKNNKTTHFTNQAVFQRNNGQISINNQNKLIKQLDDKRIWLNEQESKPFKDIEEYKSKKLIIQQQFILPQRIKQLYNNEQKVKILQSLNFQEQPLVDIVDQKFTKLWILSHSLLQDQQKNINKRKRIIDQNPQIFKEFVSQQQSIQSQIIKLQDPLVYREYKIVKNCKKLFDLKCLKLEQQSLDDDIYQSLVGNQIKSISTLYEQKIYFLKSIIDYTKDLPQIHLKQFIALHFEQDFNNDFGTWKNLFDQYLYQN